MYATRVTERFPSYFHIPEQHKHIEFVSKNDRLAERVTITVLYIEGYMAASEAAVIKAAKLSWD